MGNNQVQIV